ncbi:hypothetical protein FRC18_005782 [Serendipita sp. 400]|nr:hypothetical protein FRC18_005782 [Serendipita sp. 400]
MAKSPVLGSVSRSPKRKSDVVPSLKDRVVFDRIGSKDGISFHNRASRPSRAMLASSGLKEPLARTALGDEFILQPRATDLFQGIETHRPVLQSPYSSKRDQASQPRSKRTTVIAKHPSEGKPPRPSITLKENQRRPSQVAGQHNRRRSSVYKKGLVAKPQASKLTRENSLLEELHNSMFKTPDRSRHSFRSPSILKSVGGLPPAPIAHVQLHTEMPSQEADEIIVDVSDVAFTPRSTTRATPVMPIFEVDDHRMDVDSGPELPAQPTDDPSAIEIVSMDLSWCKDTGYDPLQKNEQSSSDPFDLFHPRYKTQPRKSKLQPKRDKTVGRSWRGVHTESYGAVRRSHKTYGKKGVKTVQFAEADLQDVDTEDLSDDELLLR